MNRRTTSRSGASSRLPHALVWTVLLASPTALHAQDARVIASNSSNGRILEIDFASNSSSLLIADTNRVSMQSCVFRDDGPTGLHILVADRNGEVVFYENGAGAGQVVLGIAPANPAAPDGLSLDPEQNLYGVTSSTGNSTASDARVWMLRRDPQGALAGGYAGPVGYIDTTLAGVQELSETILTTSSQGSLSAGDLLVLASDPPMLLRYRAADLETFRAALASGETPAELAPDVFIHDPAASVPEARRFPEGVAPHGMALTQEGNLLISVSSGTVLHYTTDGVRRQDASGAFVDFVTGLGNGQFKLATGLQDGALRVFMTDRNGGEVHRFGIDPDGSGILEATVPDSESPNGIATTTAAVTATPTGSQVAVNTSDLMSSTIENVPVAGATSTTEFVFTDPRESEPGAPADPSLPLHRDLDLHQEISSLLPEGVVIPAHVRAFRKADPATGLPTGDPTFLLLVVGTTAQVEGIIQHIADEGMILGYSPNCADLDPTMRPKLFWRDNPAAGEPPIPEGGFLNVTNSCGTSRGLTMLYSLFLPARDTRAPEAVFTEQFNGLGVALDGADCVRNKTLRAMRRQYETAQREFFERGRPDKALNALQTLLALAESSPEDFVGCSQNEWGNIRARAGATIFSLANL